MAMRRSRKPRGEGDPTPVKRRAKLWGGAAAVAAVLAVLAWWFWPIDSPTLKDLLSDLGFREMVPPSRLYGPGTINTIETRSDGSIALWPTCNVAENLLAEHASTSPSVDQTLVDILDKGFDVTGQFKNLLKANITAEKIANIYVSLKNVSVIVMSDQSLLEIQRETVRDVCAEAIIWNLEHSAIVCQTQSVLKADVTFAISVADTASADVETITSELIQNLGIDAKRQGSHLIVGEGLFYGVKLAPRGIVLNTPDAMPSDCRIALEQAR